MTLSGRVDRLEQHSPKGRDYHILVSYSQTIMTPDGGRKEVDIEASYDDVNWDEILPDANGNRIAVSWPRPRPSDATSASRKLRTSDRAERKT